jgi:hypothetical protein
MLPVTLIISTYMPRPIPIHRWTWKIAFRNHKVCGFKIHRCQYVIRSPIR